MERQKSYYTTDFLQRRAALTPDRVALHCTITGREITYAAWNRQVNQTAHFLTALGVGKGDRVAVYAANSVEYMDVWMACNKTGAILQNLNWRLTVAELEQLLIDAAPSVLIYSDNFADQVDTLRPNLSSVHHYVAFDTPRQTGDKPFSARDNQPDTQPERPDLHLDDPWVICYTGGTTGLPKGAILTHGNMTWNSINTVMSWGLDQNDVAILNAPLFHTGGLNVFTLPLIHTGGKSYVCKSFDTDQVFDLIRSGGVTVFFGVPTMFVMMQQHPRWDEVDFSGLKIVISGGAPCPMPVFERFWEKGVDFKTGYGLTEAGPNNFALPPEDVRRKPGAVGKPLFHIGVKAVDPDGAECPPGTAGELLIRGPHVTPGYWNNPEATRKAIVDGWLHTGDLAVKDQEGYYTIVGRLKDMIISGGENIYPAEVESVMHAHPAVAEAALIGLPDDKWGEVGCAVVVVKSGQMLDDHSLLDFMQERLARYKVPKTVIFVDELPKTGPGKIDKKLLVSMYST
ncbi:MAG: acyl-CoA synthetase [Chloroflexota bacterium]